MSKRFLKTNKEKTGWSGNILMTALLILAAVFIAFSLKPNQAQATNSLNSTVMTEIPGSPATCGKCHNDHSGKARRNNFGVLRYIFDGGSATMASTGEGAMDTDLDGVTTAVELAAGNFPGYPDRDGDGYVQFSARVDSGGVIYPAVTITGKYTPAGPVLGWDVDDGDSGQGNIATWSAAASANGSESTDVTPPDAVNNLRSSGVGTTAMNLAWTAPGDDGSTGTAHSFDIRYIDDGNGGPSSGYDLRDPADWVIMWDIPDCDVDDTTGSVAGITTAGTLATEAKCSNGGVLWNTGKIGPVMRVLNEPVTQVAGTSQSKTVSSIGSAAIRYTNVIANGTLYWYAMRTSDGVAVVDLLEDATIVIREGISPVSNIVAITAGPAGTGVGIQSFNTSVYNVTVGQAAGQSFTVEGYGFTLVDTAKLNNVAGAESVTCAISGKTDTAMTLTCDTSALTDATSFDVDLLASTTLKAAWTDAILIQAGPPDSTAPEDTTNLSSSAQTETSVTLAWTGAGDDGATGTPTLYDIRYSTGTVSEGTWAGDTQTGEPAVAAGGTAMSFEVPGLTCGTTYTFGLKTEDEVPNSSALSNVITQATAACAGDSTPPEDTTNLSSSTQTATSVTLDWTSAGDDGATGTPALYDIRYSTGTVSEGTWAGDTQTGEPGVVAGGNARSYEVTGLTCGTTYTFGLKTEDEVPNSSALSNVVTQATSACPDGTAPEDTTNLSSSAQTATSVTIDWTSAGDDGATGTPTLYDIRYSIGTVSEGTWAGDTQTGEPGVVAGGNARSYEVTGLTCETTYTFGLKTEDEVPNSSALSNVVTQATGTCPAAGTLSFSLTDYPNAENVGTATITVTRTGGSSGAVGVTYATSDGTATTADGDYTGTTNTLSWGDGVTTSQTFNVTISNDTKDENDETVNLTLSGATGGASIGTGSATLTITDNDAAPTVAFNAASSSGAESATPATLQVDLSAVSAKTATVDYSVTGGDATGGGTDFTLAAGTLTFNPGDTTKNISIAINNDVDNESDETIVVTIASPSNSTLGAPTAHTYTILDDDAAADTAAPAFTGLQYVGDPGSGGTVTLCFDDAVDAFPSNPVSYKVYYNATAPATGGSSFAFANPATPGDAASCGGASYNQKYDFQITATTNYSDGIKYFYTVHALDSLSNETINADDMAAIAYNRTLSAGYNMVGIPGELGGGVVDTTIYNDDVASFFNVEYYEDLQRYLMGTGTTTEGRGYYFFNNGAPGDIIDYPNCVNDTCGYSEYSASKQVASPSYVQVAINAVGTRGANMVSNPCLTSVTGSTDVTLTDGGTVSVVADDGSTEISFAAAVTATYIKNSAYRWSPGSSSYGTSWTENLTSGSEPNKMRPYSSYWIFVEDAVNARYLRFYCDAQ